MGRPCQARCVKEGLSCTHYCTHVYGVRIKNPGVETLCVDLTWTLTMTLGGGGRWQGANVKSVTGPWPVVTWLLGLAEKSKMALALDPENKDNSAGRTPATTRKRKTCMRVREESQEGSKTWPERREKEKRRTRLRIVVAEPKLRESSGTRGTYLTSAVARGF